ncbi:hypothetical protein C8J56DRAFT_927773 [Mycena floridula]|nr:hypothetical protein C8J56DRAFT_927773 [Mycena floridula]
MRRLLRLPTLLLPRVTAPLLPVSRSSLTNAPRVVTQPRLFSHFPARLDASNSIPQSSTTPNSSPPPDATLSQRLKHLIKSYGWYALGVYLIVGALDFGVAFAAINLIGAQQVSQITESIKDSVSEMIHSKPPEPGREGLEPPSAGHDAHGNTGLYAMLVLAYTVHKTVFLPVRVGLTAWCTPKLVGWLRIRGWAGGAGTRRAATEMREKLRSKRNRGQ